jgi:hypothetical protein
VQARSPLKKKKKKRDGHAATGSRRGVASAFCDCRMTTPNNAWWLCNRPSSIGSGHAARKLSTKLLTKRRGGHAAFRCSVEGDRVVAAIQKSFIL